MRIEQLGDGVPEVAVVGSIHGDEPCGRDGIEAVLADPPEVERPVKFIIANEAALDANKRYLDTDLNRSFPGDADSESQEERLAAALAAELQDCTVLSLHSTQSYDGMFALVDDLTSEMEALCSAISVDAVVQTKGANEGRLFATVDSVVEVECGYQGSAEAAENAEQVIREFLAATGVSAESPPQRDRPLPVFQLGKPIPKVAADQYEVFVRNFEPVPEGDPVAAADDETVVAEEPFHPVLLSAYGYEDVFGFTADRIGMLD
ncbi:succinylglutamate desuccinylase/aspartoacylase domain-containing protein [Haloarcula argentinensis]|uniref:Succinylglutamate desuccinylase n=1 Tax=Haloarcula argentinensis TaxID=43776 RepID=A0A830FHN2_HALAR|nr:succinylglutamate desuccinylase/aspartoacylase family protein [Haloarcula argentinensis]EMA24379.1 succinylglutamate desuccinylase/aspartoacylase [Haloarcula argentinensis DSM 12282]MDS0253505.1 succinylglutamate desuccinylase/aspartoacylase family protein [Haloarcula argentinensis]GGM24048.1 succinylglutamate desuccinylase [Haloarcula argentinensis]